MTVCLPSKVHAILGWHNLSLVDKPSYLTNIIIIIMKILVLLGTKFEWVSDWVSEWVSECLRQYINLSAISWREQVNFQWNDEVRFVFDQYTQLDFYSASPLKQQSLDRHVAPFRHIILIPSQPVFALSPKCCVVSGEAANINFIVFGLTWSGLEHTIYDTPDDNHYTTNEVNFTVKWCVHENKSPSQLVSVRVIVFERWHPCIA
jgi:hypothetical protein